MSISTGSWGVLEACQRSLRQSSKSFSNFDASLGRNGLFLHEFHCFYTCLNVNFNSSITKKDFYNHQNKNYAPQISISLNKALVYKSYGAKIDLFHTLLKKSD